MATWQFDILIVPHEVDPKLVVYDASDDEPTGHDVWTGYSSGELEALLGVFGKPRSSWSPDLLMWGPEDGTCIQLFREGDRVDELFVRIDMRASVKDTVQKLADLAGPRGWRGVIGDRLIELTVEEIAREAMRSDAARFVRDPTGFLDSLRRSRNSN